jgi:hypothetical protein
VLIGGRLTWLQSEHHHSVGPEASWRLSQAGLIPSLPVATGFETVGPESTGILLGCLLLLLLLLLLPAAWSLGSYCFRPAVWKRRNEIDKGA